MGAGASPAPRRPVVRSLRRLRARVILPPHRQIAPVVIPLVTRWATWLLGLGIIVFGGGSERTRALMVPLIVGSLIILVVGSLALCRLFGTGWPRNRGAVVALAALDLLQALLLLWLEGGWTSAFYEYAMTSVMLPAFVFGFVGAAVASAAFTLGYLWVLVTSPLAGPSLSSQVAALANPWIVAAVVAVLADLLHRLERATARNLELAASEERWRIAREIHDGVAQQSYVLALGLETAVELARREDLSGLRKRLPPLEKLSREALLEVRQYVAEGRPLMFGERSLGAALAGLGREFSTVSRIAVEVSAPDDGPALPTALQGALYRVAQESLANVFKHAEAQHAWVSLRTADGRVELEIADDGRGLDPARSGHGFGLEGMRRRVRELGGRFEVGPRPGGGTCVRATFVVGPPTTADGRPRSEERPEAPLPRGEAVSPDGDVRA